jgi:hypothetical protein
MALDVSLLTKVRTRGGRMIARCPACAESGGDRKGNHLFILEDGRFGCVNYAGDREHRRRIWELVGQEGERIASTTRPPPRRRPRRFKPDYLYARTTPWRGRLYQEPDLLRRVTGWQYSDKTIRCLTMPAFDAVCLIPAGEVFTLPGALDENGKPRTLRLSADRLGFVYDGALKIRQPYGPRSDLRFLMLGEPRRPWRSYTLLRPECRIEKVAIAEGEHDAVELVECGLEHFDFQQAGSGVVGIPGASAFRPEWARLFAKRAVTVWRHSDDGGRRFAQGVADALVGIADVTAICLKPPPAVSASATATATASPTPS